MSKLVKGHFSVATSHSNLGNITPIKIMNEEDFKKIKNSLLADNKEAHMKIFEYLYDIGYLAARLSFMYECDKEGHAKE